METNVTNQIVLWCQQPFVAQGLAAVLGAGSECQLLARETLPDALACLKLARPALVLVYVTAGVGLADLHELSAATHSPIVLWGGELGGDFAYQAVQLGVRGILPSHMSIEGLLSALQNIRGGGLCFERELTENLLCQKRITLTRRERQLVSLVAQGLKNKEIASSLGIAEGTVKVYLSRLFGKLGLKDRLDLALYGLRNLFSSSTGVDWGLDGVREGRRERDCVGPQSCLLPGGDRPKLQAVDNRNPRRLAM